MADLEGIVLHKVLSEPNKHLDQWARLKPRFFSSEYSNIYSTISNFYENKGSLPSFSDLEIFIRNKNSLNNISALMQLEVKDDIEMHLVVDALIDLYTQDETLKELDKFVDDITYLSSDEIKQSLNNISITIEDKTQSSEEIFLANEMNLFDSEEFANRVHLGFNNSFDAHTGGAIQPELIMIGGYRGSGKSVTVSNICVTQYEQGNVVPYFTIEMPANQVFRRNMAILANVSASRIKKHNCTDIELRSLAKTRCDMFLDSEDLYDNFINNKYNTYEIFEKELQRTKVLKPDNQIIIVKDRNLNLIQIDVHLTRLKERHGDRLKVCIVDYINQLHIEDMYDWKPQIELSKSLKNLAEKHELVMITPYQIDKKGEARFSKGILDAADIAMLLDKGSNYMKFKTTKIRDDADIEFASIMDWDTLRISPQDMVFEEETEIDNTKEKSKADLPW